MGSVGKYSIDYVTEEPTQLNTPININTELIRGNLVDSTDFDEFVDANIDELQDVYENGGMDAVKDVWIETRVQSELSNVHETSFDDADEIIANAVPQSLLEGWLREANSSAKPKILDAILSTPGGLNASFNIAYAYYKENGGNLSFNTWLRTPQTLYRGEHSESKGATSNDVWISHTPDRAVAEKFGRNGKVTTFKIKPIDTYGGLGYGGEQEIFVPRKFFK